MFHRIDLKAKTGHFKIGLALAFLGVFLFCGTAHASVPFFESFESYPLGKLGGQGGWATSSDTYDYQFKVVDDYSKYGQKSFYASTTNAGSSPYIQRTGDKVSAGYWTWWIRPDADTGANTETIELQGVEAPGTQAWSIQISCKSGNCTNGVVVQTYATSTYEEICTITEDQWNRLNIQYDSATDLHRISCNGATFSSWYPVSTNNYTGVDTFREYITGTGGKFRAWVDFISEPSTSNESDPILNTTTPTDCQVNTISNYYDISFTGNVEVPLGSPYTFDWLVIQLQSQAPTSTSYYTYVDLPDISAGTIYDYDESIAVATSTGYIVNYQILGYDVYGNRYNWWHRPFQIPLASCITIITDQVFSPWDLDQIGSYEPPEAEDCTGLGATDTFLCEIKNLIREMVVPTQAKMGELEQNVLLIKQKFPMNYITEAYDTITSIKDNLNATGSVSFSIWGQEGTLDNSVMDNTTTTFAGITQSFSDIFLSISQGVILISFVIWCVNFGKRIFR